MIASLAWNQKAWYGLLVPDQAKGEEIVRMEFKRFLLSFVQIPCQIVNSGRRIVYRILAYRQLGLLTETENRMQRSVNPRAINPSPDSDLNTDVAPQQSPILSNPPAILTIPLQITPLLPASELRQRKS